MILLFTSIWAKNVGKIFEKISDFEKKYTSTSSKISMVYIKTIRLTNARVECIIGPCKKQVLGAIAKSASRTDHPEV